MNWEQDNHVAWKDRETQRHVAWYWQAIAKKCGVRAAAECMASHRVELAVALEVLTRGRTYG
jgi:hypothetical protein